MLNFKNLAFLISFFWSNIFISVESKSIITQENKNLLKNEKEEKYLENFFKFYEEFKKYIDKGDEGAMKLKVHVQEFAKSKQREREKKELEKEKLNTKDILSSNMMNAYIFQNEYLLSLQEKNRIQKENVFDYLIAEFFFIKNKDYSSEAKNDHLPPLLEVSEIQGFQENSNKIDYLTLLGRSKMKSLQKDLEKINSKIDKFKFNENFIVYFADLFKESLSLSFYLCLSWAVVKQLLFLHYPQSPRRRILLIVIIAT